jgi:hypothetical protein
MVRNNRGNRTLKQKINGLGFKSSPKNDTGEVSLPGVDSSTPFAGAGSS